MKSIKNEVHSELVNNILPFWMERMKDPKGGFFGQMKGNGEIVADSTRGAILNARILWTFASAYRVLGDQRYLEFAREAKAQITKVFNDSENGGIYWCVNSDGSVQDSKKQIYAIAFAIYGLSELYRAAGDEDALLYAKKYYEVIEHHSFDHALNGYLEAFTGDWQPIDDMRLSDKDQNDAKTMNTHLHVLEGYTALYRVWKDDGLAAQLRNLIEIFLDRITLGDGHLALFFDESWNITSHVSSYGHDIEASWLLCEAADVLGDEALLKRTREVCSRIARASMEGFSHSGGMVYEKDITSGHTDGDRHWWVQAESVVGCFNQWQLSGDREWLDNALAAWDFIKANIICPEGEWYWSCKADGSANTEDDRAGFWKCPYHNGRMCMELIERIKD